MLERQRSPGRAVEVHRERLFERRRAREQIVIGCRSGQRLTRHLLEQTHRIPPQSRQRPASIERNTPLPPGYQAQR